MSQQTSSGPTQTAVEGASNEWAPRPLVAGATRLAIFIFPYMVGFTLAVLAGRFFPASRLGVNPIVWFVGVAALSTLAMIPADRLVRRLVPITGLLTVALGFPDAAPSRFKAAMRSTTTAQVQRRLAVALDANRVEADLDRNQYLLDLVSTLTRHDRLTRGHSERVRAYATLMGEEVRLSKLDQQKLYWAALLHDIGKLEVPSEILNKNGRPDEAEWAVLQAHPAAADRYLAPLRGWLGEWAGAATDHHLRWDGKGYPKDTAGTDISYAGRLVAIADAYDVMTSARSYKDAMSAADARVELSRCAGGQFDPHLVRAFLNIGLGRLRLAGGVLASLPALVNVVLSGLATNGGRVLLSASMVGGGVVAAPMLEFAEPAPIEVVGESTEVATKAIGVQSTPALTEFILTPTASPVTVAATPPETVTPTVTPTVTASAVSPPLFDFELEVAGSTPAPTSVVTGPLVPATTATVTPTAAATATATVVPSPTPTRFPLVAATAVPPPLPTSTSTALPTTTPLPTSTPVPTSTALPTATPVPVPTSTPLPTATPVPTSTPLPTATPVPTSTPLPTATPVPTSTPLPTSTPTPPPTCPSFSGCPMAVDDAYGFLPGERRNLEVLANDLDQGASALDRDTLTIIEQPEHAVSGRFEVHDGHVHYRARPGYVGPDSFTYQVCNIDGLCDTATVSITISRSVPVPDVCSDNTDSTVMFSFDPERRNAMPLDRIRFVGPDTYVTIYAAVPETTDRVAFYVDDPGRLGQPFNVEYTCAFDLLDTGPDGLPSQSIAIGDFGLGMHTITIVVIDEDGSSVVRTVEFAVAVRGNPGPAPTTTAGVDCAAARAGQTSLQDADLTSCLLTGVDLRDADLAGADLSYSNLEGANLTEADLSEATLIGANLTDALLTDSDLDKADLSGANLTGAVANNIDLQEAVLVDAILVGAVLGSASLDDAMLQRADLTDATLNDASFSDADLTDAVLIGADISEADFSDAILTNTNLTDAIGIPDDDDAIFANTTCPDSSIATGFTCWP